MSNFRASNLSFILFLAFLYLFASFILHPLQAAERKPVQSGYEEAFYFVRDNIRFQVYRGVLKGTERTRFDGAGNSLDRALLLQALLEENGYSPRIAQGFLSGENLRRVAYYALGMGAFTEVESIESTNTSLPSGFNGDDLSDHYWIQIPAGSTWLDLDPSLPTSMPGETIAQYRKQLKTVPSFLYQRLEVTLSAEFSIGQQRATSRLLRFTGPCKDLIANPLILLFLNRTFSGEIKYTDEARFDPVLIVGDRIQPALNLKVEATRMAARASGPLQPAHIHRIWAEYILKVPGLRDKKAERLLYSELQPEQSRLDEMTIITMRTNPDRKEVLQAQGVNLQTMAASIEEFSKPIYPIVLSEKERLESMTMLSVQQQLAGALANLLYAYLDEAEQHLDTLITTMSNYDVPRLLALSVDPVRSRINTDILLFETRPIASEASPMSQIAMNFSLGVYASALEGYLLKRLKSESNYVQRDSVSLTKRAFINGIPWIAIDAGTIRKIDEYPLDTQLLRRLEGAVTEGKIIIIPDNRRYRFDNNTDLVWWEMDAKTGAILGMITTGTGGSELTIQDETIDWGTVSAAYAPGFQEGWPKRLSQLCRNAARLLKEGADTWKNDADFKPSEAIRAVYMIVSTALSENSSMELSNELREFLSSEGRIFVNDILSERR